MTRVLPLCLAACAAWAQNAKVSPLVTKELTGAAGEEGAPKRRARTGAAKKSESSKRAAKK